MNNGVLDTTFGTGGFAKFLTTPNPNYDCGFYEVELQPDGKIIGVGNNEDPYKYMVARFEKDGSLDAFFGDGNSGYTITDSPAGHNYGYLYGVALQPDGKIVVVGTYVHIGTQLEVFAVRRYDANGFLDEEFGTNGLILSPVEEVSTSLYDVVIQPDGKIIAVGASGTAMMVRYHSDGSLDASFGNGGYVLNASGQYLSGVVLQPDGKIVVAGSGQGDSSIVARYHTNGSLDESFNAVGYNTSVDGRFSRVALRSDGKIVAAGHVGNAPPSYLVAQYNTDGSLDEDDFGTNGLVSTSQGLISDLVLQPDGKIIVCLYVISGTHKFWIIRFNADGSLDSSFGTSGSVEETYGSFDFSYGIALQPDGKIISAGSAYYQDEQTYDEFTYFVIARYNLSLEDIVFPTEGRGALQELGETTQGSPNDILTETNSKDGALVEELPGQQVVVGRKARKIR